MSPHEPEAGGWAHRRAEFLALASRSREVVLLAAVTGALTGLGVALFERVVIDVLFDHISELSPWLLAFVTGFGLVLAALGLRYIARSEDPATAVAYLRAFHEPDRPLRIGEFPGLMFAATATT